MERIYTIEQHDNGWSIGDDLGYSSVCEENETLKVRMKIVFEEVE